MEPYKATRKWNEITETLFASLPRGRRRCFLKTYDNCFQASEAVAWLHRYLKNDSDFGDHVTRKQAAKLLEKFHSAKYIEDVRSLKTRAKKFADDSRLYRFTNNITPVQRSSSVLGVRPAKSATFKRSPVSVIPVRSQPMPKSTQSFPRNILKSFRLPRDSAPVAAPPAASVSAHFDPIDEADTDFLHRTNSMRLNGGDPPLRAYDSSSYVRSRITNERVYVWKFTTLKWLMNALNLWSLEGILNMSQVKASYIIHNITKVNRHGIVSDIDKEDQFPVWLMTVMRKLANWPDNNNIGGMPAYDEYAKDVFVLVTEYFTKIGEPLFSEEMSSIVYNIVEYIDEQHSQAALVGDLDEKLMESVENLILNMTLEKNIIDVDKPAPSKAPAAPKTPTKQYAPHASFIRAVDPTTSARSPLNPRLPPYGATNNAYRYSPRTWSNERNKTCNPSLVKSLRILLLLLKPSVRYRLHLMLRLMCKMSCNTNLSIHDTYSTRKVVLNTLTPFILNTPASIDGATPTSSLHTTVRSRVVALLMDNYGEILSVPDDLYERIKCTLKKYNSDTSITDENTPTADTRTPPPPRSGPSRPPAYCERITTREFESGSSTLNCALTHLLETIVNNEADAPAKETKKHLKRFQKSYPDIYEKFHEQKKSVNNLNPNKQFI